MGNSGPFFLIQSCKQSLWVMALSGNHVMALPVHWKSVWNGSKIHENASFQRANPPNMRNLVGLQNYGVCRLVVVKKCRCTACFVSKNEASKAKHSIKNIGMLLTYPKKCQIFSVALPRKNSCDVETGTYFYRSWKALFCMPYILNVQARLRTTAFFFVFLGKWLGTCRWENKHIPSVVRSCPTVLSLIFDFGAWNRCFAEAICDFYTEPHAWLRAAGRRLWRHCARAQQREICQGREGKHIDIRLIFCLERFWYETLKSCAVNHLLHCTKKFATSWNMHAQPLCHVVEYLYPLFRKQQVPDLSQYMEEFCAQAKTVPAEVVRSFNLLKQLDEKVCHAHFYGTNNFTTILCLLSLHSHFSCFPFVCVFIYELLVDDFIFLLIVCGCVHLCFLK